MAAKDQAAIALAERRVWVDRVGEKLTAVYDRVAPHLSDDEQQALHQQLSIVYEHATAHPDAQNVYQAERALNDTLVIGSDAS